VADYTPYAPGINAARSVWDQGIAPLAEKVQGFLKGTAGLPGAVKDYAVEAGQSEVGPSTKVIADLLMLGHGMREGIKEDPLRAIAEMYPPVGSASDLFETNQLLGMAQNAEESGDLEKAQTLRELANTIVLMGMVPGGPPAKRTIEQKIKEMVEKRRKLKEETGLPYVPNKKPPPPEGRRIDLNEPELDRIERQRRLEQAQAAPELDLSPAARAARATEQGYVQDVYHGTLDDFSEFDPSEVDIGVHVGSSEQATNRLLDIGEGNNLYSLGTVGQGIGRLKGRFDQGSQVMPLKARMTKTLELSDVGEWRNSFNVIDELIENPQFKHKLPELRELRKWAEEEARPWRNEYGDSTWDTSPDNREALDALNRMIRNEGFDSIKYLNRHENNLIRSQGDPYSYIILDPKDLRSPNAKFDPAKAGSADLLSGIASIGATEGIA